jgi:fructokinase
VAERTGRIVVIGDALVDEIRDEMGSREFVGGAGLNLAVGLGVLGVRCTMVAMVADDADGRAVARLLAEHGVPLVATAAPNGTARATSERIDGEPRYVFNAAAQERAIAFGEATAAVLAEAPIVVVSCYPFDRDEAVDALLAAVEDPARRLVVDPNPRLGMMRDLDAFRRNVERVAAVARLVKIGDEDAELLFGEGVEDAARRLAADGAAYVLATAGRAGATLLTPDGRVDAGIADLPGAVVDTMGAGDATLASITAALRRADVQGLAGIEYWRGALENAMTVAAATVRNEGALLRLP